MTAPPHARHSVRTRGDANLLIAPRTTGQGAVPVLLYTTDQGVDTAVQLTTEELTRIRDAANNILSASAEDIETWLDRAAQALMTPKTTSRP